MIKYKPYSRKKQCYFTKNNISYIDYKDVDLLINFIGKDGRILTCRSTGTKAHIQKRLATAIKRARYVGLLPFCVE